MMIIVPGDPVPKGRPRFNRTTGSVYTPATTRAYEQAISILAMAQRKQMIKEGPVKVTLWFYTSKTSDIDNLIKSTLDGLNGQAFTDDKQIVELHAIRVNSNPARTEILIEAVGA